MQFVEVDDVLYFGVDGCCSYGVGGMFVVFFEFGVCGYGVDEVVYDVYIGDGMGYCVFVVGGVFDDFVVLVLGEGCCLLSVFGEYVYVVVGVDEVRGQFFVDVFGGFEYQCVWGGVVGVGLGVQCFFVVGGLGEFGYGLSVCLVGCLEDGFVEGEEVQQECVCMIVDMLFVELI